MKHLFSCHLCHMGLCLILLVSATQAHASELYISDELVVTMRSGPSNQHKVIGTLNSGERVNVVETRGKFSKVKTDTGKNAWVLTQYLQKQPIHKQLLLATEKKLEHLSSTNNELKQQLDQLQEQQQNINTELEQLNEEKQQLGGELQTLQEISSEPEKIYDENRRLRNESQKMQTLLDQLRNQNTELERKTDTRWFLAGAAVILLGIIIGTALARILGRRKGDSWSNLR